MCSERRHIGEQKYVTAPATGDVAHGRDHRGDALGTRRYGEDAQIGKSESRDVLFFFVRGEVRQLTGMRHSLLSVLKRTILFDTVYSAYRYGWEGTYQIMLVKR